MKTTRRNFLKSTLVLGGTVIGFPTIIPSSVLGRNGKVAPSNRVCMAFIGTGNQGTGDMFNFLAIGIMLLQAVNLLVDMSIATMLKINPLEYLMDVQFMLISVL